MRILMLGNSLTTANGLSDLLAARLKAQVDVHARGGARLSEHMNPATKLGARTQAALAEGGIDFLVMQEMSNGPARFRNRFLESTRQLAEAARTAGATPVLYAIWAHAPGCPKLATLGLSYSKMHEAMHAAALEAALGSGALLADVCQAFHEHPNREALYAADGVHPSPEGTQVALQAIVGAIVNAIENATPANLSDAAAPSPNSEGASTEPAATSTSLETSKPYTVYLLRCKDGSYYTGITTDMERRLAEHLSRGPKAANYTRTHPVAELAASWPAPNRAEASRLEYRIKRLKHGEKKLLATTPELLDTLLNL